MIFTKSLIALLLISFTIAGAEDVPENTELILELKLYSINNGLCTVKSGDPTAKLQESDLLIISTPELWIEDLLHPLRKNSSDKISGVTLLAHHNLTMGTKYDVAEGDPPKIFLDTRQKPLDTTLEVRDRTPVQYFVKREDGLFELKEATEPITTRFSFRLERDFSKDYWPLTVWANWSNGFVAREPLEGVNLDVGKPATPEGVWDKIALPLKTDEWQGILKARTNNQSLLLMVCLREEVSATPSHYAVGTREALVAPQQFSMEARFLWMPLIEGERIFADLIPLTEARPLFGESELKTTDQELCELFEAWDAQCDVELLSAPRVTTMLGPPPSETPPATETLFKIVTTGSGQNKGNGSDDTQRPSIDDYLVFLKKMDLDWFSAKGLEYGGKPAIIADLRTEYFTDEGPDNGKPPVPHHVGIQLAVRARATEDPQRISAELAYQHTWDKKDASTEDEPSEIGISRAAFAVECRYDQPVLCAYPGPKGLIIVIFTFERLDTD